jgi:hypothetical protein
MITQPDVLAGLLALIRQAAREGTAEAFAAQVAAAPSTPAARATLDELASLEKCSRATIRRLVSEGAPGVTYLGQSPRFDVEVFRSWLTERGRKGTRAKPSSAPLAGVRLLSARGGR